MYQIVFSLGYYGIKKTPKKNKWQGMQLSPMNTTDVTLKTQNEIGGCGTQQICHGMSNMKRDFHLEMYTSKSLLVIVSTEIKKIKLLNRT